MATMNKRFQYGGRQGARTSAQAADFDVKQESKCGDLVRDDFFNRHSPTTWPANDVKHAENVVVSARRPQQQQWFVCQRGKVVKGRRRHDVTLELQKPLQMLRSNLEVMRRDSALPCWKSIAAWSLQSLES